MCLTVEFNTGTLLLSHKLHSIDGYIYPAARQRQVKLKKIIALLGLCHSKATIVLLNMSPYQKHNSKSRYKTDSPPDKYQVILNPSPPICPKVSKFSSHEGIVNWEAFSCPLCWVLKNHLGRTGNKAEKLLLSLSATGKKVHFYWSGSTAAAALQALTSCGVRDLASLWRFSPSP